MRFLVVGAGAWGTAFTRLLLDREHDVLLACRTAEQAQAIAENGWNPQHLQHVDLRAAQPIALADALASAVADVDVIVAAVPSAAFGDVVEALPGTAPILSLAKGLDPATGERLSTRVRGRPVAVLSGPNMAEEIAAGLPTAAVIASEDGYLAGALQHALSSALFRAYVNPDLVGVELCGAAKNVIALAAGGVDGLRLGDNAKASLIARGLAEMSRLGDAAGARPETFSGLAGIGDLITTCFSPYGRNRHAGELIAQGLTPEQAVAEIGETVEGLTTAPILRDLAHRLDVELPITEGVCAVLSGRRLGDLVAGLMGRAPTEE
jgi:glycerol-3-phosphate dehydrogenase (NAD(P)+)